LQNNDEADEDRSLTVESERRVENLTVHEHGKDEEIEKGVDFADDEVLDVVVELPVTEFVS
jgi:monomeric isocitrate dehydrogenase